MPISFTKAQGAGNDFIIFDLLTPEPRLASVDWPALARALCDRHFGIGADGLLLVLPPDERPAGAAFRMRILNSDGSEPEMCGNGLRCFVRYLHDRGLMPGPRVAVQTGAGMRHAELLTPEAQAPGFRTPGFRVRIDMGRPELLGPEELPVADRLLSVTRVSMGNPHGVTFVDDLSRFPFTELGPLVESHPRFPERINAEFAEVLDRSRIRVKVWERGAGPTLACGTGACAVAVAASSLDLAERRVLVELPGGVLEIDWQESGNVFLTGPAELVFTGEVDLSSVWNGGLDAS